jgi:hypothetical protein
MQGGELAAGYGAILRVNAAATAFELVATTGGSLPVKAATASNQAVNLGQANSLYAPVSGNAAQTFAVANATATNQAVNLGQANSLYAPVSGNAAQTFAVANATATNQAVALGQFSQRQFYLSSNTTTTNVAANSTATLLSIALTTPSFSKTGGFRVFVAGQIAVWPSGGSPSQQPLTFYLNDGTNNLIIGFLTQDQRPTAAAWSSEKLTPFITPDKALLFPCGFPPVVRL